MSDMTPKIIIMIEVIITILCITAVYSESYNLCECSIKIKPYYNCYCDGRKIMPISQEKIILPDGEVPLNKIDGINIQNICINSVTFSSQLKKLSRLYLNSCNTTTIDEKTFLNIKNLDILYIENTKIKNISNNAFKDLKSLDELMLKNNSISTISDGFLRGLFDLTVLNLEMNKVEYLNSNLFQDNKILERINLDNNKIKHLPNKIFNNLLNLYEIHLQNNRIQELPDGIFDHTQNLKKIYLQNNEIKNINENIFKNIIQLEQLNLEGNNIKNINLNFVQNLPKLRSINIPTQSITCDCKMKNIFDNLKNVGPNLECFEPLQLRSKKINELHQYNLACRPKILNCHQEKFNNSTQIICEIYGDPEPSIAWKFEGTEISFNQNYQMETTLEKNNTILTILTVYLSEGTNGEYEIQAYNSAGKDMKMENLQYIPNMRKQRSNNYRQQPPEIGRANYVFIFGFIILSSSIVLFLLVGAVLFWRNYRKFGTYNVQENEYNMKSNEIQTSFEYDDEICNNHSTNQEENVPLNKDPHNIPISEINILNSGSLLNNSIKSLPGLNYNSEKFLLEIKPNKKIFPYDLNGTDAETSYC